jgi:DNA-binding transcriptional MerR regulator
LEKEDGAFLTIGELSEKLAVPQHVLRYWETRFPALKPLTRAGNRRYYRPADVALAEHIDRLLNHESFTIKGAQRVLASKVSASPETQQPPVAPSALPLDDLMRIRNQLAAALLAD